MRLRLKRGTIKFHNLSPILDVAIHLNIYEIYSISEFFLFYVKRIICRVKLEKNLTTKGIKLTFFNDLQV